jgi:UDP-N-acetylmuramate dehydrogenase
VNSEPLHLKSATLDPLRELFGERLTFNTPLARYTAARVGGPADAFLAIRSADELAQAVDLLWEHHLPYLILGGGSNVLVSDAGVGGVVLLNRARRLRFSRKTEPPCVWVESGASLGLVARQAASRGFSGLEWAAGIPGTVGGAVYGNAGAHGADMAGNLIVAEILHQEMTAQTGISRREELHAEQMGFAYRTSSLKRQAGKVVVLAALLKLGISTPEAVKARLEEFTVYRRRTQPPGASMGSMFKNPPGDYAGRLIEAAGLKGRRIGNAQISTLHGNFFLNIGRASASDILALIELARQTVAEKFGLILELEIELVGNW